MENYGRSTSRNQEYRRIDFIIGGAQKSGTSALHSYLNAHPAVQFGTTKELHFFDSEVFPELDRINHYANFHKSYNWLRSAIRGDATPVSMYLNAVPYRIFEYSPKMKWIVVLRNPIVRAFSHWNMHVHLGMQKMTFRQSIELELRFHAENPGGQHRLLSYIDRGRYAFQLERLKKLFGEKQLLIIRYEALLHQPTLALQRVFSFLDIEPVEVPKSLIVNRIPYTDKMSLRDCFICLEELQSDIARLEGLLGWDCADWLVIPSEI